MDAATITGGLVDPTLVREVEQAGYAEDFVRVVPPPPDVVAAGRRRRSGAPNRAARWRQITVDRRRRTISRPVGVRLDSGGIAKGLFGDVLAALLSWHQSFALHAAGDIRFGGAGGVIRPVQVTCPFDAGRILHTFELARGAARGGR